MYRRVQKMEKLPQYSFQRSRLQIVVPVVVSIFIGSVFLLYPKFKSEFKKNVETAQDQGAAGNLNHISSTTQPHSNSNTAENFPVKIYVSQIDHDRVSTKSGPAPCQPEFFDPKTSKFIKVKQSGTPAELYKIEGFPSNANRGVMMIDGWRKEGENKLALPAPFSATVYNFGCASNFSSVIDLLKNGNRQALYSHVLHYSFSKDGKKLFLVNNINNHGIWTKHRRIINIESKVINEIPNIKCASELGGFWQGDRLLTYTKNEDKPNQTDVCIWNTSAKLIAKIGATLTWHAWSEDILAGKIGLLPMDPNVFYTYADKDKDICSLFLINVVNGAVNSINILDKKSYPQIYSCSSSEIEFDFSELYFDRGKLRYRIEEENQSSEQKTWSDWQTLDN